MINVIFTNDGYTQQHDVVEIDNVNIDEHPSFVEACEQKDIVNNTMITLTWRSSDYHGLYVLKLGTFPLYKAYLEIDGKKYTYTDIMKNIEKFRAMIEQEKVKLALETLA